MEFRYQATRDHAIELDANDPLSSFRDRFHMPTDSDGQERIYFLGNSLGLQPRNTEVYLQEVMDGWKSEGVNAFFRGHRPWSEYQDHLIGPMAGIVGAHRDEVVIMNSLTVNLHLLLAAFYRPTASRHRILIEDQAFPSDQYAVASQIQWHGYDPQEAILRVQAREGENTVRTEDIVARLEKGGGEIALVMIGGVNYYTGQAIELEPITRVAHRMGCIVGFDLAHAAGNIPLALHDSNVDFAAWCSYKYLNGGPGGPGGAFIHRRHSNREDLSRLSGWWGHNTATRFQMPDDFDPIPGAAGWQLSTSSILSLAPLRASLELFEEVGFDRLVEKSRRLTGYLDFLVRDRLSADAQIVTPGNPNERGSQLSIRFRDGKRVFDALEAKGVSCDWREPDVIRLAPVPFYNRFEEVFDVVEILSSSSIT